VPVRFCVSLVPVSVTTTQNDLTRNCPPTTTTPCRRPSTRNGIGGAFTILLAPARKLLYRKGRGDILERRRAILANVSDRDYIGPSRLLGGEVAMRPAWRTPQCACGPQAEAHGGEPETCATGARLRLTAALTAKVAAVVVERGSAGTDGRTAAAPSSRRARSGAAGVVPQAGDPRVSGTGPRRGVCHHRRRGRVPVATDTDSHDHSRAREQRASREQPQHQQFVFISCFLLSPEGSKPCCQSAIR